ncbi:retinal pigment epithelial membrane protein [Hirsutella rhossiliensis]|uniref:Retinal pigment epithelial membrane protein n=1 Tax=Hirsutella rhossiliensis TaxID=111463 RepID=A0A9P8SHD8_9HYPO|nr:retinal pigment epithelial membrane protein [Hirsutella rhossiliensis]KAH0962731.1 retinal pigment epithelial membrane protein [Hirsutella rhossiliensis]
MALNASGTILRTVDHEKEDTEQILKNTENQSWKVWPNGAGFEGLEEHRGPLRLHVKGTIPSWAAGTLYRTGPGQNVVENTVKGTHNVSHWFDGFAHTHKFDIVPSEVDDGSTTVLYSSRRQSEAHVANIKETGWRSSISFGQKADPCVGLFAKFMSNFTPQQHTNNVVLLPNVPGLRDGAPTNLGHHVDRTNLYISTDTSTLQSIDPATLEPLGFTSQILLASTQYIAYSA